MSSGEMNADSRIYVAGHRGLVGGALVRRLEREGFRNIITATHAELDLTDQAATDAFFAEKKPEYVICAAAKVGGIMANRTYPVDFLHDNILIQTSILRAAHRHGAAKTLLLGSSCIYPRMAPQPIREDSLLTGPLEATNQWYAIAKIAGIMLGQAYRQQYGMNVISAMPTNLYGRGDNFDLETSHVLPAMIRKFHDAKVAGAENVTLWGSGTPLREFLHVDDLADACVFLMRNYNDADVINIGSGKEISIKDLAALVADVTGFAGKIVWDASKPDGTPRKLMDDSKMSALGWRAGIGLRDGVAETYRWFADAMAKHLCEKISLPPAQIPDREYADFTMSGKIPVRYRYYNGTVSEPIRNTPKTYKAAFEKFDDKTFEYYGDSMNFFYEAIAKYPMADKTVIIFGLAGCNLEAFAVWCGAKKVVVVDYNKPVCEHEKITVMTHDELLRHRLKFDVGISFSSFEHDGLGRYGDPLKPYGDFDAMSFARNSLNASGVLYFAVPLGRDCLDWNAHRIYGRVRLPLLLRGWKCMDVYGTPCALKEARRVFGGKLGRKRQPLLILQPADDGSVFEDMTAERVFSKGFERMFSGKIRNALINLLAFCIPQKTLRRRFRDRWKSY